MITDTHSYISEAVKMRRTFHENEKSPSPETCQMPIDMLSALKALLPQNLFNHFALTRSALLCGSYLSEAQLSATIA